MSSANCRNSWGWESTLGLGASCCSSLALPPGYIPMGPQPQSELGACVGLPQVWERPPGAMLGLWAAPWGLVPNPELPLQRQHSHLQAPVVALAKS